LFHHCLVYLCTFLNFCFTISWRPTTKRSDDGDEPMNQPVDKMVNQYFRWRCELLDNRPIQGSLNCYLYKFFTFLFHHCRLLVITHPSW
jgi:hypothetical protein